jgi:hypothetical protein
MTKLDERERADWVVALAQRLRRLAGACRPARPPAPRPEPRPPTGRSPTEGAEEVR